MKEKKIKATILIFGTILLGCTACGKHTGHSNTSEVQEAQSSEVKETKETESETENQATILTETTEEKSNHETTKKKTTKKEAVNQPVKLTHTYQTKFAKVNMVTAPEFCFQYPDNWTVTKEVVNGENSMEEVVKIANKRGVEITYVSIAVAELSIYSRFMDRVEISKVGKASFVPGYVSATDYSSLGKFAVAKLKVTGEFVRDMDLDYKDVDGAVSYAVLPETMIGEEVNARPCEIYEGYTCIYFHYPSPIAFFATSPDGKFTPQEEKEVIAILSSFKET